MKNKQRLGHESLVDALRARGLVQAKTLEHILHQCQQTGALLTEQLVRDGIVSDWELAQLCSETFGLPFMPVDLYEPDRDLLALFEPEVLRQNALVPLERFGKILVVAMPCMVPSDVLESIQDRLDAKVMPVVGSVRANVRFLEENLAAVPSLTAVAEEVDAGDWSDVLDMGDAAVQVELVTAEAEAAIDGVESGLEPRGDDEHQDPADRGEPVELLDLDLDVEDAPAPLPDPEQPAPDFPKFGLDEA
ncbi:MAG: hypothetical protein R3F34_15585 [Planctomycetota bacterium]